MSDMNREYSDGAGWKQCFVCGVKDRVDQLELQLGRWAHGKQRSAKCFEWRDSLARATVEDLERTAAISKLVTNALEKSKPLVRDALKLSQSIAGPDLSVRKIR